VQNQAVKQHGNESGMAGDLIICALISLVWVAVAMAVGLRGEFPLNDDWAYAKTIQAMMQTGRFERMSWTWVPLYTNMVIGGVFSWLWGGFSHEALRASGIFMGWVGLIGSYLLMRQMGGSRGQGVLGTMMVGLNPLYLNLSFTFMTDVPFAALWIWSALLLLRGVQRPSPTALVCGALVVIGATLSRQLGLALLLAFVVSVVLCHRNRWARYAVIGAGVGVVVACAVAVPSLLFDSQGSSGGQSVFSIPYIIRWVFLNPSLLHHLMKNGISCLLYLGVFVSPLVAMQMLSGVKTHRGLVVATGIITAGAMVGLILTGKVMPTGLNVMYDMGLGPNTIPGHELLPQGSPVVWWVTTFVGVASIAWVFGLIGTHLLKTRLAITQDIGLVFLLLLMGIYLLPLASRSPFFDRYLIPVVPILVAVVYRIGPKSGQPTRWGLATAMVLLGCLGTYSILGTYDYMHRNRVRWGLIEQVLDRGASPETMDGGFEFNRWFNYDRKRWNFRKYKDQRWVYDDQYILSYAQEMPGYDLMEQKEYQTLLPLGLETQSLFKRRSALNQPSEPETPTGL